MFLLLFFFWVTHGTRMILSSCAIYVLVNVPNDPSRIKWVHRRVAFLDSLRICDVISVIELALRSTFPAVNGTQSVLLGPV